MRKLLILIAAVVLMTVGLNAQRTSGLSGTGLDGFIETTTFDSLHTTRLVLGAAGTVAVSATAIEINLLDGVLSTTAEIDQRALTVKMIDVSSAGQVFVVSPYAGNVTAVYSVLNAAIATADAVITIKDTEGNTMGQITIAYSGSAAGDVDSVVSISNADVAVGDLIEIETNNASTNAIEVEFTILIAIQ